jgi:hypothetical protein
VDPRIQNIRTVFVCGRNIVILQIFKTHNSSKAKKRYGHSLWMNVPGSFHEARVIAYAAVHLHKGIDARVSCCGQQARDSSSTPAHNGYLR